MDLAEELVRFLENKLFNMNNNNFKKEFLFLLTVIGMAVGVVLYVSSIKTDVAVMSNTIVLEIKALKETDTEHEEKNKEQDKLISDVLSQWQMLLTKLNGK